MIPRQISVKAHPQLDARAFATDYPAPLGTLTVPPSVTDLLRLDAPAPFSSTDAIRQSVRNLLRYGGFKPTGRSKPASEYLLRTAEAERLASINLAVDLCNAVSLHTGLPISVVDLDRVTLPLRIEAAPLGAEYVFNSSGQVLDLGGLLCPNDDTGPCGNAVKDAQRTKTCPETTRTLSIIWGTRDQYGLSAATLKWYLELVEQCGGVTEQVPIDLVE